MFGSLKDVSGSGRYLSERVSLLYRFDQRDVLPLVLIAVISAFALWGFIYPPLLGSLLVWFVVMRIARAVMSAIYRRANPPPEDAARWEDYYGLLAVVFGAVWGIISVYFYSGRDQFQELTVTFLISVISLGLPASLAPSPKTFVGFLVPLVTPLIGMLMARGGASSISVAMMMLLYSAMVLWLYLSANRALLEKLALDAKNTALTSQVRDAKERLSLAVSSSQLSIWEWAADRGNMYLDEGWARMLGRPPGETLKTVEQLLELAHPDDRQLIIDASRRCLKGESPEYHVEHRVLTEVGDWKWILSRGQVVERDAGGRALRMIGTNIDISGRKLAEGELMATLQREKELSDMKSKFVSMASHEFRTPLATILSSSELIEHYSETLSAEDRAGVIGGMKNAVQRMSALLDDVLTIGKSDAGVLQYHGGVMHLRAFCEQLTGAFQLAAGKQHVLEFEHNLGDDEPVEMDERLLHHIIDNLLTNAAKYSSAGKTIRLGVRREGGEVHITVTDQGIGIPEKDQARLFEGFFRASNVDKRLGTGLGLAIVKKAVESHSGKISFTSVEGEGTRFEVSLPLRIPAADAA
jgi:PAS domain S-box-containing protein